MRTGASDVPSRGHRGRIRPDARLNKTRKTRLRRAFLENESLEARTLLATIPTPAVISRVDVSNPSGITDDHSNESTPSIAVDPMDSQPSGVRLDAVRYRLRIPISSASV